MPPPLSAYVPCFNNRATILDAVRALQNQTVPIEQVFVVDDGSTDGSVEFLESQGIQVVRQEKNLGRGAARSRAMKEAHHDLVLCCDATNTLPPDFVEHALHWFDDESVAGVFGVITDPAPRGAVNRWRARHLFKVNVAHPILHKQTLITFGTLVRASAVTAVGGYDAQLRHSEDHDLGNRLLAEGYDVISDPALKVVANVQNTLFQVLERYWRWYVGKEERFSMTRYLRSISYSLKWMALQDIKAGDPLAACISMILPHYQLWRYIVKPLRVKHRQAPRST